MLVQPQTVSNRSVEVTIVCGSYKIRDGDNGLCKLGVYATKTFQGMGLDI